MNKASAPGKVILLGEHAVVYGQPAIAVPVSQVRATAVVTETPPGTGLTLIALDLGQSVHLREAAPEDPLAAPAFQIAAHLDVADLDGVVAVTSDIPIAGGMGSSAAISAAIIRALADFVGAQLTPEEMNSLVFEVEKLHHGTPSGIDNTVVVYEQPVYFIRNHPPETFAAGEPLHLLIAITGIPSPTRELVGGVRARWEKDPGRYDFLFDHIGELVAEARDAIEEGDVDLLGELMDQNHELLQEMGVSSPTLDGLVETTRLGGALGAKLSGAGGGGNIVALVERGTASRVEEALTNAGAAEVIPTVVE